MSEDEAAELGLLHTWVYHCGRCNHLWIPRDFELDIKHDIFEREPPKSCARCKSKYWRQMPQRKTKNVDLMLSVARVRALHRHGKLKVAVPDCDCQYCTAINAKEKKKKEVKQPVVAEQTTPKPKSKAKNS